MSDLREAAERYRNSDYEDNVGGSFHRQEDAETLADAYLAEQDETAIDEQWLESIGFESHDTRYWSDWEIGRDCDNMVCFRVHYDKADTDYATVNKGGRPMLITTRGQLRKLLSALSIPSDEAGGEK